MLPPSPSPVWTSSNPSWEFQAFRRGQEKPAVLAEPTSPCESLRQGERQQPGLTHLHSSGKVGATSTHPSGRDSEPRGPSFSRAGKEDTTCPRVKGRWGLREPGRSRGWGCRTQARHRVALCGLCSGVCRLLGNHKALGSEAPELPQRQASYWRPEGCPRGRFCKGHLRSSFGCELWCRGSKSPGLLTP